MEVWAWGANNYGQLGTGTKCEQIDKPVKILPPSSCTLDQSRFQIAGGGGHTLLSDTTRLFGAGWNNKGQLGIPNNFDDVENFEEIKVEGNNEEKEIKKLACGWDFSVLLYKDGNVFVCGSNAFGQIGLGEECKGVSMFVKLKALSNIRICDVSCGMRHTLFLEDNGNVYSTGCGKKGQLGLGETVKKVFTPKLINALSSAVSVNCGQHFSVVIATSQTGCEMFTFGDNKYNQVSDTSGSSFHSPHLNLTSSLVKEKLIAINCGWTHVVILLSNSDKTRIESWGRNTYGQLGSATHSDKGHTYVELEDQPGKMASGYEHVLVVTNNGKLYTWGWNEHSNCGVGNSSHNYFQPQLVSIENKIVQNCYAGSAHSFALVKSTPKF